MVSGLFIINNNSFAPSSMARNLLRENMEFEVLFFAYYIKIPYLLALPSTASPSDPPSPCRAPRRPRRRRRRRPRPRPLTRTCPRPRRTSSRPGRRWPRPRASGRGCLGESREKRERDRGNKSEARCQESDFCILV